MKDIIHTMRVPFEWLKEFIDITIKPEEVADKLTMIGLEVEGIERLDSDVVFEINVTPNRPDCLSIRGIARELSAALNIPLKPLDFKIKEEESDGGFKVEILNPDLCNRYAGRIVEAVKVSPSPDWIKGRLAKCGIRSINNVVDVTNYVLLELGHPLHAFDLNTLKGRTIRVGLAGKNNEITTLDGIERKLPEDALLIWDAKNPVAVAGIMGGADTEVTDSTTDVFLESAWFEPKSIRRTSKALGIKTESSYRFERGADLEFLSVALDRAASLMQELAGGKVYKKVDAYPERFVPVSINVRHDRVNKVLGTNISNHEMVSMIRRLDIEAEADEESFTVNVPSFRPDLKRETDIVEEIARVYGYQRIDTTIPKAAISSEYSDIRQRHISKIKDIVRGAGYNEAINYSFMNEAYLDMLNIPQGDRRRRAVTIKNPLRKEDSLLRTTLIPSLIENLTYNFSRGVRDIRIFEVSKVFKDIGRPLPLEIVYLSGIFYRDKLPSLWKDDISGFYLAKGTLEAIFESMHIKGYTFSPSREPFLHPGQSCDIRISGAGIGFLGAFSPHITDRMDLKAAKPEIIVFEIDIDRMISMVPLTLEYSPVPKFPYIERDIAIIVDDKLSAAEVETLIRTYPSELIEDVSVFDLYKGKNIPEGKKSLAFAIKYRSKIKTLTDAEVEDLHSNLVRYIAAETGGKLRV